ncbi:MAG: hypothetical protein AAGA67_11865 [Cyanobacteria bacterium P01_F01_bin.153]
MARPKRERVSVRIEAEVNSLEGKMLHFLKDDPIIPPREAMLRATKAFYMPWALEGEIQDAELRSLARTALEELQFRIFQIQQRFLLTESPGYIAPAPQTSSLSTQGSVFLQSNNSQPPVTVSEMRKQINPAELDDF